jgi:hypothetical protein
VAILRAVLATGTIEAMWWRRREATNLVEPLLTREELNGLIEIVMRVDDTTQEIKWLLEEEDDDGEPREGEP